MEKRSLHEKDEPHSIRIVQCEDFSIVEISYLQQIYIDYIRSNKKFHSLGHILLFFVHYIAGFVQAK